MNSPVAGGVIAVIVVTVALTTFGVLRASASPVTGSHAPTIGIQLIGVAGAASRGPLARSYIVARLAPGAHLSRFVEIDNDSRTAITVDVYAAAASVTDGHFLFANGAVVNDLASWTSTGVSTLRLRPFSHELVSVTTRVPSDAPSGEDYAVLWAATSAPPGRGITLVSRVGVRMYVAVGKGKALPSNFFIGPLRTLRSATGESLVVAQIRNTGANTLDLSGSMRLSNGPSGLTAGPFTAQLDAVLPPRTTESVRVLLSPRFPRGPWRASLRISGGELSRSISQTIYFPRRSIAKLKAGDLSLDLWILPFALLIGIIPSVLYLRSRSLEARARPTTLRTEDNK